MAMMKVSEHPGFRADRLWTFPIGSGGRRRHVRLDPGGCAGGGRRAPAGRLPGWNGLWAKRNASGAQRIVRVIAAHVEVDVVNTDEA
jgi:hypothetical protein